MQVLRPVTPEDQLQVYIRASRISPLYSSNLLALILINGYEYESKIRLVVSFRVCNRCYFKTNTIRFKHDEKEYHLCNSCLHNGGLWRYNSTAYRITAALIIFTRKMLHDIAKYIVDIFITIL